MIFDLGLESGIGEKGEVFGISSILDHQFFVQVMAPPQLDPAPAVHP
jgi:hypothetical protein